jgi:hypothetical protein
MANASQGDVRRLLEQAAQSVRQSAQGVVVANPLYPLPEDNLNPINALLAAAHRPQGSVSLPLPPNLPAVQPQLLMDVCVEARALCSDGRLGYSSSSYPTRNLTAYTLAALAKAQGAGATTCTLDNLCCSRADCPQIQFQRAVLEAIERLAPRIRAYDSIKETVQSNANVELGAEWQPLIAAAGTLQLQPIAEALMALGARHQIGFQEVERVCRARGLRLFLMARRCEGGVVARSPDGQLQPHKIWMSTRFPLQAIGELLEESASYAENFAKLAQCGFEIGDAPE